MGEGKKQSQCKRRKRSKGEEARSKWTVPGLTGVMRRGRRMTMEGGVNER